MSFAHNSLFLCMSDRLMNLLVLSWPYLPRLFLLHRTPAGTAIRRTGLDILVYSVSTDRWVATGTVRRDPSLTPARLLATTLARSRAYHQRGVGLPNMGVLCHQSPSHVFVHISGRWWRYCRYLVAISEEKVLGYTSGGPMPLSTLFPATVPFSFNLVRSLS